MTEQLPVAPLSAIDAEIERRKTVRALDGLRRPARYKTGWGGRGGSKSWEFARTLLMRGAGYDWDATARRWVKSKNHKGLRVMCARETMHSIKDSVHQLLSDQIALLGLHEDYEIQKAEIIGRKLATSFVFGGVRLDVDQMKSLESVDVFWVEEATRVTKSAWDKIIPTVRKEGSEIWVSFNPELPTDETYLRFVLDPPPDSMVMRVNYIDNPYCSLILRNEAEHCRLTRPDDYRHIWLGECRSAVSGAVYGTEIAACEADGRICDVPYDRSRPVDTFWDLGFGDATAVWFVQSFPGWFHVIDYMEGSGQTITDYMLQMQRRGYLYGTCFLPHDALDTIIHGRLAAGDKSRSIEQIMRGAGYKVQMIPKMHVHTGINAVRTMFPQLRFDREKCVDGLQWLRRYQWGEPSAAGVAKREPLHDGASHAADALRGLGVAGKSADTRVKPTMKVYQQGTVDGGWMA